MNKLIIKIINHDHDDYMMMKLAFISLCFFLNITGGETEPWWEIDLEREILIQEVVITNMATSMLLISKHGYKYVTNIKTWLQVCN